MTNRRLAVTSRSAAHSSPSRARRASRRSSWTSVTMGSFLMSCRYWSNDPSGTDERRAGQDFPERTRGMKTPMATELRVLLRFKRGGRRGGWTAKYGKKRLACQQKVIIHITKCDGIEGWSGCEQSTFEDGQTDRRTDGQTGRMDGKDERDPRPSTRDRQPLTVDR